MNNFFDDWSNDNLLLDFETPAEEAVALSESQIEQAAALSSQILDEEKQWQTYLQALASFGLESWLRDRDPQLSLNWANCSLRQPQLANFIPGVFNLEVAQFKLCLLTPGVILDQVISLPRALLDLPQYVAHFYVVVTVDEEREEAIVTHFIPYQELKRLQQSENLQPDSDWHYQIPIAWFNSELDQFLLFLRCLEPNAIALPTAVSEDSFNLANLQSELQSLIPQLQSRDTSLEEILTWEQAIPIITNPALLNWLYELKTSTASAQDRVAWREGLAAIFNQLTQRAINVGAWLQNEIDQVSQTLAWNLLPDWALATSSFRDLTVLNRESPSEELAAIVTGLRNTSIDIPTEAASAYHDFTVGETALRLFAIAWQISASTEVSEWSLLVILGAQPEQQLPRGLQLRLQEEETILDQKSVEAEDNYLYTLVIGTVEEQFTVKLILPTGETFSLPPFAWLQ